MTVTERFATSRYYCLMPVHARVGLTLTFKKFYTDMRKANNSKTGKPLSEATVEGLHSCLCGILSDAMEGGLIDRNPAWRTYRYVGRKRMNLF